MASKSYEREVRAARKRLAKRPVGPEELQAISQRHAAARVTESLRTAEQGGAHMCRDGHTQIWHNDSEHELCPLCRAVARLMYARRMMKPDSDTAYVDSFLATLEGKK